MKTEVKEQQEEAQKKPNIEVNSMFHDIGEYSLCFTIKDRHIDLNAWNYTHTPSYRVGFTIYEMTLTDMYDLALAILQVAENIKAEEEH